MNIRACLMLIGKWKLKKRGYQKEGWKEESNDWHIDGTQNKDYTVIHFSQEYIVNDIINFCFRLFAKAICGSFCKAESDIPNVVYYRIHNKKMQIDLKE